MKLSEMRKMTQNISEPKYHFESANMMEYVKILGLDTAVFHHELEMDSPFVDTYRDITYSNADVQLHSHTFFEILYCRSANGTEYLIGPHRYKLQNGDLVFVPPGVSHRPILPNNMPEPYIRDVMWINADFMGSLYRDGYLQEPLLLRTAGTKWEYLGELFGVAVWESENTPTDWDIAVLGSAFCLLSHLRRACQDTDDHQTMAEKSELLDQVLAYIEAQFSERVTIAGVARHVFVREGSTTHLFSK